MFESYSPVDLKLVGIDLLYLLLGVLVLLLAKYVKDWLTPFKLDIELTQKDNPALGLAICGYFLGVVIVFLGAVSGDDFVGFTSPVELFAVIAEDLAYAVAGILALNLGRVVLDRVTLPSFSVRKEIIEDRNLGAGAMEAGTLIATALVIAGAISGSGGGPLSALVFFVIGQLVLVAFARVYDMVTRYDLHEEIECDNVAAGVACGLTFVAVGIVMLRAVGGDFEGWVPHLMQFAGYGMFGIVAILAIRPAADWLFLPGSSLDHEIAADANLGAAFIEGTLAICLAAMIFVLM